MGGRLLMWYDVLIRKSHQYCAATSVLEISQFGGNGGKTSY